MTKAKNQTTSAHAAPRAVPAPRAPSVKSQSKTEAGIDMNELARKIAANMQVAHVPAAPQTTTTCRPADREIAACYATEKVTASPIDSAFADLAGAVYDLEAIAQELTKKIEPILMFDSNELKRGAEATTAPASPMQSRIIDLTDQVRLITAHLAITRSRVQL